MMTLSEKMTSKFISAMFGKEDLQKEEVDTQEIIIMFSVSSASHSCTHKYQLHIKFALVDSGKDDSDCVQWIRCPVLGLWA